jgi:FHA domain-containing protein/TIR domain-containing protein
LNRVFISCVQQDTAIAGEIADGLAVAGYQAWYSERDALAGPSYQTQVRDAIRGAKAFILLVSKHTLMSNQAGNEITAGLEHNVIFVALLMGVDDAAIHSLRPEWARALGSAVFISMPPDGVPEVLPRILSALTQGSIVGTSGTQVADPPFVHVLAAGKPEHVFPVRENGLTLGRDTENDVLLLDDGVSRRHARLEWNDDRIDVTDLDSKNGTKVGGTKLTPGQPHAWNPEDMLEIGPFQLRLEVPSRRLAQEAVIGEPGR